MSDILASGSDYLAHHGVLGMKWGVRKKVVTKDNRTFRDNPHVAKAIFGIYGRKQAFTSQKALSRRVEAGKLRLAYWAGTGVLTGVNVANTYLIKDPKVKMGIDMISKMLSTANLGVGIAANATAAVAASEERRYRLYNE